MTLSDTASPASGSLPAEPARWGLNAAQRAVWLDLQMGADPVAYQLLGACWIDGPFPDELLQQSLNLLAARHDALRLRVDPHRPEQWLDPEARLPLHFHRAEGDAAATALLERLMRQPLPRGDAPMLAFDLVHAGGERRLLCWRVHHLIADGLSMDLLLQRWLQTCHALSQETVQEMPAGSSFTALLPRLQDTPEPLPRQAELLAHWQRRLAGRPKRALLPVPADPMGPTASQRWTLAGEDYARFVAACKRLSLTHQQALQGLYMVALASRFDHWDLTVGMALHGREFSQLQVMGMFSRALPIRVRLDPLATLERNLQRVATAMADDLRHHALPTDLIARAAAQGEGATHLYDSAITFRQVPAGPTRMQLGPLGVEVLPPSHVEIGGLGWHVIEYLGSHVGMALCHRPERLAAQHVAALSEQLQALMAAFGRGGARWLFEQPALTDAESGAMQPPAGASVPARIEALIFARCQEQPEAIALQEGERRWTYRDVQQSAQERAQGLRLALARLAPGRDEPVVALRQGRSADTVIWMLAILQVGAVLLPIDPELPLPRQVFMAADAGAVLTIGYEAAPSDWPSAWWQGGTDLAELPTTPSAPSAAVSPPVKPERLAYLIYTSGSTGQPKPVGVAHAAVANLIEARRYYYPVGPGDRVLATAAVGFDVAISQMLMPLAQGACIVMAPPLRGLTPSRFWSLVAEGGVSHLNATPSLMEAMLDHAPGCEPGWLIVGGEALSPVLARRLVQALSSTRILNVYGPTETCIDASQWPLPGALESWPDDSSSRSLPIGRGLRNYQLMVLDSQWRLAAPGVIGEIFIGGAGLARGYLGQPAATARSFLPNPWGAPGSRMYRTGDRGRWQADGTLEFLGRLDDQVKVRGFRIETGEIAAEMLRVPGTLHAAVIARPLREGAEPALVAYWVGEARSAAAWRDALAQRLPAHMLPTAYVPLAELPLTVNAKLDRRALPAPTEAHLASATREFQAAEGEREQMLLGLWQDLLGLSRIGRNDSFFALGGNSLGLVRLAEQLRQQGWSVDMARLFAEPTIAALAGQLSTLDTPAPAAGLPLDQAPWAALLPTLPGGADNVEALLPLTAMQQGLLYHHVLDPLDDGYQELIRLGFPNRAQALEMVAVLQRLQQRHQALRLAMRWEGLPHPVQVVLREAQMPLQWRLPGEALPRLDVAQAPLLALVLEQQPEHAPCELTLVCHHLILDHESMALLVREGIALHRGLPMPDAGSLGDWLARSQPEPGASLAHFRQALAGLRQGSVPFGLNALDRRVPGRRQHQRLPAELTLALRQAAQAQAVSTAALFHLAWARCLAMLCGSDDVVFGTVLLGRARVPAPNTLGLFVNTLPLRVKLGNLSTQQALQAVHEGLGRLLAHEQASLSEAIQASGLPAAEPLFSTLLNFRHSAGSSDGLAQHWPGLQVLEVSESATFVIDLAVDDEGDALGLSVEVDGRLDPGLPCRLMLDALAQLLQSLPQPRRPMLATPLLTEGEVSIGPAGIASATPPALHGAALFHEAALRHPQAPAVCDGERRLSYAELAGAVEQRAEQLARALAPWAAELAAGREPVIGLALPRSVEVVIWLLALHRAGVAALPMDADLPRARLELMLQDARALAVVCDPAETGWSLPAWHTLPTGDHPPLRRQPAPGDIAYIIYTSGSTGRPKGVAVPHSALTHLSASRQVNDPLGPGDVVLATSSIGFDIAMGQLLLPLYQGACVVVSPPLPSLDAQALATLLQQHRVSHVDGVPSFYELLLQTEPVTSLKSATLGGERITPQLVRRLRAAWPAVRLLNVYGPTEATIDGTAWMLEPQVDLAPDATQVPIGQAMPNYRAYVLDAHWQPVGPGAAGELWLAGPCVARGYLAQPRMTAERFLPDPWGAPGSRMYRTGDRVLRQPDGQLVYLGRRDAQVKLRGQRIELAEIEQHLLRLPAVRRVALRVQRVEGGPEHLLAYLEGEPCSTEALRQHCLASLPASMCPSGFVWLQTLPLTPNGKLDMAALPAPEAGLLRGSSAPLQAPRTELERRLHALWLAVLGPIELGVDDHFWDVGGHSLALLRLQASLAPALGRSLPLRALFEHSTIAAQAAALDAPGDAAVDAEGLLPLRRGEAGHPQPAWFAIYPYGGTSLCYAELARALPPGPAVWGLQAPGLEPGEQALDSLPALASHAIAQMRRVQPSGSLHLLGFSLGGLIGLEIMRQLEARGEAPTRLALLDSPLPGLPGDPLGHDDEAGLIADVARGLVPPGADGRWPDTLAGLHQALSAALPEPSMLGLDDTRRLLDVSRGMLAAARAFQPDWRPDTRQHLVQVQAVDDPRGSVDWQDWLGRALPTLRLPARHDNLLEAATARTLGPWLGAHLPPSGDLPHA